MRNADLIYGDVFIVHKGDCVSLRRGFYLRLNVHLGQNKRSDRRPPTDRHPEKEEAEEEEVAMYELCGMENGDRRTLKSFSKGSQVSFLGKQASRQLRQAGVHHMCIYGRTYEKAELNLCRLGQRRRRV